MISTPVLHGARVPTSYQDIGPHDSSNRLAAFIQQFEGNFDTIQEYFSDKFWSDMFERLCKSEKPAGDAISFQEILLECVNAMTTAGKLLGPRETTVYNEANLSLGLKVIVGDLCTLGALQRGFTLKCPRCATIAWYAVEEVASRVDCHGCRVYFSLPIESPFSYRLNALVQKNIYQSRSQHDGNLTVILTLARLYQEARRSFAYSPQLNLYPDYFRRKPLAEIDIISLGQGRLTIGEAKYNSSEFRADKHKSLNSLIAVTEAIRPDRVLLACTVDTHNHLHLAKEYLEYHFRQRLYGPAVEAWLLSPPTYFNFKGGGIFTINWLQLDRWIPKDLRALFPVGWQ